MKPGPKAGAVGQDRRNYVDKAGAGWGDKLPDWVVHLAAYADTHGAKAAGAAIGYSNTAVSMVINGKYPGDLSAVEQKARGAFMGATVICPVLDEIGRDRCMQEQKEPFRATSAMRARLFHACRTCPNNVSIGAADGEQ